MTSPYRRGASLLLAIVCSVALAACSSGVGGGGAGGSLLIGDAATKIDSLNPFVGLSILSSAAWRLMYPYLTQYDPQGHVVGDYAESFTPSDGGRVWTYKLHPGGRWTDGKPLTASDVVWTLNTVLRLQAGAAAQLAGFVPGLASVSSPDAQTVVTKYSQPLASAPALIAYVPILPRHVWGPLATGNGSALKTYANSKPVTAGSFEVTSYVPDQDIVFARDDSYYGAKPTIGRLGIQEFSSSDELTAAIESGQVNAALELPSTVVGSLESDSSLRVATTPGTDMDVLAINSNPKKLSHRELLMPRVREAISLALDESQFIKVITLGQGAESTSIIPPSVSQWSATPQIPADHNIAKANAILDSLGFRRGPNGVRSADGRPMRYVVDYAGATGGDRVFQILQQQLQAIGISVTADHTDQAAFTAAVTGPDNKYLNFDMALDDWVSLYDPSFTLSILTCAQWGGFNDAGYCNPAYEKLNNEQLGELNPAKHYQLVIEAQQLIAHDKPWIPLFVNPVVLVTDRSVSGLTPSPLVIDFAGKQWLNQVRIK